MIQFRYYFIVKNTIRNYEIAHGKGIYPFVQLTAERSFKITVLVKKRPRYNLFDIDQIYFREMI